ncbi:hypothetical protein STAS_09512 [Striga asiatica]|uniref:Uncharacterized protein n=1 Tax=Striga asiatica TaxID=4170 RepID=A0A5A7PKU4_STRAF|nr:hypothetical protein STAS_09512 [Striga asiatica]
MSTRRRVAEERLYYSPPAMRMHNQQQQQQKQQQSKLTKCSPSPSQEKNGFVSESYLDRFLEHTTPSVAAQHFTRTSMRSWRNRGNEFNPYFILGDLWESFREWSVYGVGVPLLLNGNDSVVQYYVPSLSGIQLYIDPTSHVMDQRRPGEESDANSSRDTSSDGDNESGTNTRANSARGPLVSNPPGLLIFEYFERELPFHREPLADKMLILASRFPKLKTYRSCDLTPSSWISIAWYPIYRIPVGPTLQNVDACFLTFHSLAKPVRGGGRVQDANNKLSLPTFGLVSYKFKVSDRDGNGVFEGQKVISLLRAADNWLRLLQVNHPDYKFFMSHNTFWR